MYFHEKPISGQSLLPKKISNSLLSWRPVIWKVLAIPGSLLIHFFANFSYKFFENSIHTQTCCIIEISKFLKKEIFYVYKLILMFQYEISVSDYMHYPRMNSHHHLILKVNITLRTCTNFQNLLVYSDDMLNWSILDIVYYTYFHLFKLIKLIRIFKKIIIANTT